MPTTTTTQCEPNNVCAPEAVTINPYAGAWAQIVTDGGGVTRPESSTTGRVSARAIPSGTYADPTVWGNPAQTESRPLRAWREVQPFERSPERLGMDLIYAERRTQRERFGTDTDDAYVNGELVQASRAYELGNVNLWPWSRERWKPSNKGRNLIKAGALIMAEEDRIRRIRIANMATLNREDLVQASEDAQFDCGRLARLYDEWTANGRDRISLRQNTSVPVSDAGAVATSQGPVGARGIPGDPGPAGTDELRPLSAGEGAEAIEFPPLPEGELCDCQACRRSRESRNAAR